MRSPNLSQSASFVSPSRQEKRTQRTQLFFVAALFLLPREVLRVRAGIRYDANGLMERTPTRQCHSKHPAVLAVGSPQAHGSGTQEAMVSHA